MNYQQMIANLKGQRRAANATRKTAIDAEVARIEALIAADATVATQAYAGPEVVDTTDYTSKRVKPLTTEAQLSDDARFDATKAKKREVVLRIVSGPEGNWVSATGEDNFGKTMSLAQFKALRGTDKLGSELPVTAHLIEKGQWYPGLRGSETLGFEATINHWFVAPVSRRKSADELRAEIAREQALEQAESLAEKLAEKTPQELARLEAAMRMNASLAKAASYKAAPAGLVMDTEQ